MSKAAPLSDAILVAVAKLVDDAGQPREPAHSEIEFQIDRVNLKCADPNRQGKVVGKEKRVRAVLSWALEHQLENGEKLVGGLLSTIQGCGGFREESSNFVGREAIANAASAFRAEGFELSSDGEIRPLVLENLSGVQLTEALKSYVRRACRGVEDAALVTGTGKDLLEATAAHVITVKWGAYSSQDNFPTLLGQAFTAAGLATTQNKKVPGEAALRDVERALYELGCAVNRLRNKEGTGHGRPWLPSVTRGQGRRATEAMGLIAEHLLAALGKG